MINVSVVLFTGKIKTLLYWDTIAQLECTNSSLYYLLYHLWEEMSHSSSVRIVHRKCVKNMKTFQLSSGSLKCFFSFFFFFLQILFWICLSLRPDLWYFLPMKLFYIYIKISILIRVSINSFMQFSCFQD